MDSLDVLLSAPFDPGNSIFIVPLRHCDKEDVESLLHRDDLFSLKIRLMYMRESRHLVINIRQKDNEVGIFNKAYSIFGTKSGSLHIWDFSGQTHQLFVGDNKSSVDIGQPDEEVRIGLQIYGLPYTINDEDRHKQTTGVCPVCKKLSTTFDPFMYLLLPLPSSKLREMTLTVLSTDGTALPRQVTILVPDKGTFKDLVEALGRGCSLRDDETLLIAEVFFNSIRQLFDDPNASIDLVLRYHQLVAYRFPKAMEGSQLVEFKHLRKDESFEMFGIPLVAWISDFSNGSKIREKFLNLVNPFLRPQEGEVIKDSVPDFKFYLEDNVCFFESAEIEMDEPVDDVSPQTGQCIKVLVSWPHEMSKRLGSFLPVVCRTKTVTHESTSLYKCMDAFLKEEPLGTWYCPNCKEHTTQARKKLDLWRLPEILVIHLKRYSKLETTLVDFPFDAFDLSDYITQKNNTNTVCNRYKLYAVSNHYGGMAYGGHYTAFVKNHRFDKWYEFDDSHAVQANEGKIKSKAAYVLFYRRIWFLSNFKDGYTKLRVQEDSCEKFDSLCSSLIVGNIKSIHKVDIVMNISG